jgi:hypothetical protein
MCVRIITFYIVNLSTKTAVMTRIATETEEKAGLKRFLILSYHPSFEALVCKQGVRINVMAQREA